MKNKNYHKIPFEHIFASSGSLLVCGCGWAGIEADLEDDTHPSHGIMAKCPACGCGADDMEESGVWFINGRYGVETVRFPDGVRHIAFDVNDITADQLEVIARHKRDHSANRCS